MFLSNKYLSAIILITLILASRAVASQEAETDAIIDAQRDAEKLKWFTAGLCASTTPLAAFSAYVCRGNAIALNERICCILYSIGVFFLQVMLFFMPRLTRQPTSLSVSRPNTSIPIPKLTKNISRTVAGLRRMLGAQPE